MSKRPERRISRRTATLLLRGAPVDVPDALAGLLAAAAAPPRDGETDREPAAVAAFVAAADHVNSPRPRSVSLIGARLTVKVAAAAVAIFAVGGVVAVAATGHLGAPGGGSPASSSTSGRAPNSASAMAHTANARPGMPAAGHGAVPSPSLVGLCHAYTAGAGSDHGKALDSPAFTALITAAGGRSTVDAYCTALLNQQNAASGSAHGADSTTQNAEPGRSGSGHQGTDHPTGPPSSHPTGPPSTHSTGPPTGHPNP